MPRNAMMVGALALAMVVPGTGIAALPTNSTDAAASSLLGHWALDVTRLAIPPAARPRSVILNFAAAPGGRLASEVVITAPDGSVRAMRSVAPLDGSATVEISGDRAEADHVALKLVDERVLVMALARGATPASTRIYTLAPDRAQLTETAVYIGEDGQAVIRTSHFIRAR